MQTAKIFQNGKHLDILGKYKTELGLENIEIPWLHKKFPVDQVMDFLSKDKKMVTRDTIEIICVKKPGEPEIVEMKLEKFKTILTEAADELRQFTY